MPAQTPVTQSKIERGRGLKMLESYLAEGKLAQAEAALTTELQEHPKDDQSRFGLGVLQFLRAVERLAQDLHRYGLRDLSKHGISLPFLRLPIPQNYEPEVARYEKIRKIFETLIDNLARSEATLAGITDDRVTLPLKFGMIRLDLDGDGRAYEDESLWRLYAGINRSVRITKQQANDFSITFDRGDVHWLRGYCHLLTTLSQVYLAYDSKETFECTAHMFFEQVESPNQFLHEGKAVRRLGGSGVDIADLVALVHLIRWEVVEPERMPSALHHLEEMVRQSKEMWKYILAETDDDREWIPNPRQTGVIPDVRVTEEMVQAWTGLMGQIERILAGDLLIAFWRGDDGRGVNLRRVFLEPRRLDLVLWVQGPAACRYLERGETTKIDTWRALQDAFGSQFPGFAIWFN